MAHAFEQRLCVTPDPVPVRGEFSAALAGALAHARLHIESVMFPLRGLRSPVDAQVEPDRTNMCAVSLLRCELMLGEVLDRCAVGDFPWFDWAMSKRSAPGHFRSTC